MDDVEVVTAICEALAMAGVGQWRPAGPGYSASEVGIFYGAIGSTPDLAIGVTLYAAGDPIGEGAPDRFVQVRSRGDRGAPHGADRLAGAVFRALHGTHHTGGIARIARTSTAHLGADENGRQERTDNYRIILNPAPGGTP